MTTPRFTEYIWRVVSYLSCSQESVHLRTPNVLSCSSGWCFLPLPVELSLLLSPVWRSALSSSPSSLLSPSSPPPDSHHFILWLTGFASILESSSCSGMTHLRYRKTVREPVEGLCWSPPVSSVACGDRDLASSLEVQSPPHTKARPRVSEQAGPL